MNEEQVQKYILKRLGGGADPDEIAFEVCETTGLNWNMAEKLVEQVQSDKAHVITRRQSPLLFLLATAIFAFGAVIVVNTAQQIGAAVSAITVPESPDYGKLALAVSLLLSAPEVFGGMIFGLGLMAGSIAGMTRVWSLLLFKD